MLLYWENLWYYKAILECSFHMQYFIQMFYLSFCVDISGGCSVSMLDVIGSTTAVSNLICDGTPQKKPINYKEAFRLATLGGSKGK